MSKYMILLIAIFFSADAIYFWYTNGRSLVIFLLAITYFAMLAFAIWLIMTIGWLIGSLYIVAVLIATYLYYALHVAIEGDEDK